MALPFIKKVRRESGVAMQYRTPDESKSSEVESDGLELAAEDLIKASSSGDKKGVAAALRAAFEILESEPHEEYDHESDDSIE